jgi:MIP family channel proteins
VAEFIGTFMLVFVITAVVSLFVVQPTPQVPIQPFIDWSVIGLAHAVVLFMIIQTLAVVSGAHFNPAVTVAMAAIRQIRPPDAAIYIVVQIAGGILGALLTKALLEDEGRGVDYGAPAIGPRLEGDLLPGFVVELVGTFFLMWAIVGVAVNPNGLREWAGLVIGLTLGLIIFIFGPLTGGSVNPARAFGPALVSGEFGGTGDFLVAYVLGPVVGALLAAFIYFYMFILPGKKAPGGMEPVG